MAEIDPGKVISTILKYDAKVTSYKIALLPAINDVVLSFPDLTTFDQNAAVPLPEMARFWIAYYYPFVTPDGPILQGPRVHLGDELRNDMAFRKELTELRSEWDTVWQGVSHPSDGFVAIHELGRVPRPARAGIQPCRTCREQHDQDADQVCRAR